MDIGIAFPSYIDAWREVQAAEEAGIDNVVISVVDAQGAKDLIEGFGKEVIPKRR